MCHTKDRQQATNPADWCWHVHAVRWGVGAPNRAFRSMRIAHRQRRDHPDWRGPCACGEHASAIRKTPLSQTTTFARTYLSFSIVKTFSNLLMICFLMVSQRVDIDSVCFSDFLNFFLFFLDLQMTFYRIKDFMNQCMLEYDRKNCGQSFGRNFRP